MFTIKEEEEKEENKINKILLFGSTGMLGRYIYSYFKQHTIIEVVPINYRISNDNFDLLEKVLLENNINNKTCVINCIGLIPQRKNKSTTDTEYFLVNSIFPQILWSICKRYNAKMIQPTTDCVFSGKKGGYVESDSHDETNSYGMSKSLGEPAGCTCIRTSIIGKEVLNKKSFLEWVISNNNNKINGWTNHMWNGITCLEYCEIIEKIIKEKLFWSGVRHIYSPTPKSKYEMSKMIADIFDLGIEINDVKSNEPCDKTLLSDYDNLFEIKELYIQINKLKSFKLLIL
uniref:RmlD-like substrate binding domain-containing protein n=1 Tax=viral metagenome TaxID=1070528 RepID=A0A6C0ERB9_9ZZZZ